MKRAFLGLMLAVLFVCLLVCPASAENAELLVAAGESGNGYLFTIADETYLVGLIDRDAFLAQHPDARVDYVVLICDHAEHVEAAEDVGTVVLRPQEEHEGLVWQSDALLIGGVAFSVTTPVDGCVTLDCQGNFLTFEARTNASSVNVRATPSTKGKRVEKLSKGVVVTVCGQEMNDAGEVWFRVLLSNGEEGYIRADLLMPAGAVEPTAAPASSGDKKDNRYVGNKNSKVFHRPGCEHLPKGKNAVYFSSRSYAIAKGYRPCDHCDP